jgi:hypothetical protein
LLFFAKSAESQNLPEVKYSWYDHVIPLINAEFCRYDFVKFGVKWPTNIGFNSFSYRFHDFGVAASWGLYYHRIGIFNYTDFLSANKRSNNAEIGLFEEKIIGNIDSLKLSKGNYYQQKNGFAISYTVVFKNFLKFTPIIGWQRWKMLSEVELVRSTTNEVLQYFFEEKRITNLTFELKLMPYLLFGERKEINFENKKYYTRKGITFEPSCKFFLGRNLSFLSMEVGYGEFLNKPFNSTIIPMIFFGIGRYQGEINSTVHRIGINTRFDFFHLISGK